VAIPTPRTYLPAIAQLALAQLFTNVLMQSDITLLGRFLSFSALGSGLQGAAAVKSADEWVAVYRACQLFAFLPYQLVLSITQILFPMVARAHAEGDRASVRLYVGRGARLATIACGLFVAVVAALPGSVLGFAYGGIVAERGESTLRVLALGQGAFTMFGVAMTVLASLGKERISMVLGFTAVVCVSITCWSTARLAPYGELQLRAAAAATSGSLFVARGVAAIAVRRYAGSFVPPATAARVLCGVGVAVFVGMSQPRFGKLMTPLAAIAIAGVYLFVLLVTRELSGDDARLVLSLVGRKAKLKTTPPPPR
jgi:stage V sporulation protein B